MMPEPVHRLLRRRAFPLGMGQRRGGAFVDRNVSTSKPLQQLECENSGALDVGVPADRGDQVDRDVWIGKGESESQGKGKGKGKGVCALKLSHSNMFGVENIYDASLL